MLTELVVTNQNVVGDTEHIETFRIGVDPTLTKGDIIWYAAERYSVYNVVFHLEDNIKQYYISKEK